MEILYEDRDIAVVVKPVGSDSEEDVPNALQQELGGSFYTVHRLDLNVGGVMVYARNQKAAGELSRQIQNGTFEKEYVAMVHGIPEESGDWTDLLFKDSRKNKVFVVKKRTLRREKGKIDLPAADSFGAVAGAHSAVYRQKSPDPRAVCQPGLSSGG